jgi:hypothetical protein
VVVASVQTVDGAVASDSALATLDAMARLARDSSCVVHVVSPREAGVVERARVLAIQAGLDVSVDLLPNTVRVRFSPR